ncbi:DUF1320 domain-containing protein [Chitinophaga pendula]|uniref:phage protein Gp36 family protein n=1 Tax=Chitinophaga TaxID=79328 RepID=UPI000BAFF2E6|nr:MULTISPECIES: phage protein Gp36 family protein [Chitinophaga]ASZ11086.1 hypothetical protein CK934_08990 [Chitinophaga sp. MD30]UCJ05917.1 DUF1320 domain-containing protein [Chitinophaga pendula]
MFLNVDELSTAIYEYQLNAITESKPDISQLGINAAIEEMKSYLNPSNQKRFDDGRPRYDVKAIFSATGADRNALILELCKSMAVWYICRIANVDIINDDIKARYDRAIDWLEKVSSTGKYAGKPSITPDLPLVKVDPNNPESIKKTFRAGSRPKFNHE